MAKIEQASINRNEFKEELIKVRRVAKVVKGGRIFSFSALTVVGDGEGTVGIGIGKAREVPLAVRKSFDNAKRNVVKIHIKDGTLQYPVIGKQGAATVIMRPAAPGTGIIAGNTLRAIFELAGINDVLSKIVGTTNSINVARATINGLKSIHSPEYIAAKRSKKVWELFS